MNFLDILRLAIRNLREARLRVALTTVGVVVGVAVIVSMVSFGLGLQRNTLARFRELDLFNEIEVFGRILSNMIEMQEKMSGGGDDEAKTGEGFDETRRRSERQSRRTLDDKAIEEIAALPHVVYVEPNLTFSIYMRANNRVLQRSVGGVRVPNSASRFNRFAAGRMIDNSDSVEVVVDEGFVKAFGFENANAIVGAELQLLTPDAKDDGARTGEVEDDSDAEEDESVATVFGIPVGADSGQASVDSAIDGLVARAFRVVGVMKNEIEEAEADGGRRFRGMLPTASVYLPLPAARELAASNRNALDDVALRLARVSGALGGDEAEGYRSATVRVDDPVNTATVESALHERGFNSFGLFSQLDELRIIFLVINSALALLGGISLLVASFGIANTMVMAILERTREIGIMKAIGAEDREIKMIFFVEAGVIGFVGGVIGVIAAWGITRVANYLAFKFILESRGAAFINFFYLPSYLWLGAILFAVVVAILAALYPATRAARVDPVQALRHT